MADLDLCCGPLTAMSKGKLGAFLTLHMSPAFRGAPVTAHYLHVYFGAVYLLSYCLDDSDDNILQPLSLWVVVQDESFALLRIGAAEGRRPHAGVDGSKVVMQSIKVLRGRGNSDEKILLLRGSHSQERRLREQTQSWVWGQTDRSHECSQGTPFPGCILTRPEPREPETKVMQLRKASVWMNEWRWGTYVQWKTTQPLQQHGQT